MSFKQFKIKLKQYEPYEDIVALKLIEKHNLEPSYVKCITNSFDIKLSNNLTYELKCDDVMASKTNNFFIEHFGYGKPSGISTTQANFYVLSFDVINYYQISVIALKKLLATNNYKIISTRDKLTYGQLVPINDIISISELI
jgi:hypothetical protein